MKLRIAYGWYHLQEQKQAIVFHDEKYGGDVSIRTRQERITASQQVSPETLCVQAWPTSADPNSVAHFATP